MIFVTDLPHLFVEMHHRQIETAIHRLPDGGMVIIPREPLGEVSFDQPPPDTVTLVTLCFRRHAADRVVLDPASKADLDVIRAWCDRHVNTTRERFDWLPFANGTMQ